MGTEVINNASKITSKISVLILVKISKFQHDTPRHNTCSKKTLKTANIKKSCYKNSEGIRKWCVCVQVCICAGVCVCACVCMCYLLDNSWYVCVCVTCRQFLCVCTLGCSLVIRVKPKYSLVG